MRTDELTLRMDSSGEQHWSFPDLQPGEVLVLPNGSRIWIDPTTGAIVDRNPVGASISPMRGMTRGEEVMFAAGERSPEHVAAGTQRLHGATSPGLGGDAPYSIAGGPPALNLRIENSGIEAWVRTLRDNAPPGVQYVFETRTIRSASQDLISRSYQVTALENGRETRIASFEVQMRNGGITDADVTLTNVEVNAPGYERYGSPLLRNPRLGETRVGPPRALEGYVGRGNDARPARPVAEVDELGEAVQDARADLGRLALQAGASGRGGVDTVNLLSDLEDALTGAADRVSDLPVGAPERSALLGLTQKIEILGRLRTRTETLRPGHLAALIALANGIAPR